LIPYSEIPYLVENGSFYLVYHDKRIPLKIFGKHNIQNISGAKAMLNCLEVGEDKFTEAVSSFPGAKNRLEIFLTNSLFTVFRDFAHAPSKVRASVLGVKDLNPERQLVAILELHTYSSLNPDFLSEYSGSLEPADTKFIYLDDHAMKIKRMEPIAEKVIHDKFRDNTIIVIRTPEELTRKIRNLTFNNINLLFMSSGNFGGINFKQLFGS
jgi:UDP-N-acetylmuramate-alanine ligase